ncbi:hypothetical protein [Streptomyces sp. LN325]|uniref:hypothetical protein n=1 Tax=Streptomyces sp. LN325 TaxID=3112976 RepID=UPI00371EA95E
MRGGRGLRGLRESALRPARSATCRDVREPVRRFRDVDTGVDEPDGAVREPRRLLGRVGGLLDEGDGLAREVRALIGEVARRVGEVDGRVTGLRGGRVSRLVLVGGLGLSEPVLRGLVLDGLERLLGRQVPFVHGNPCRSGDVPGHGGVGHLLGGIVVRRRLRVRSVAGRRERVGVGGLRDPGVRCVGGLGALRGLRTRLREVLLWRLGRAVGLRCRGSLRESRVRGRRVDVERRRESRVTGLFDGLVRQGGLRGTRRFVIRRRRPERRLRSGGEAGLGALTRGRDDRFFSRRLGTGRRRPPGHRALRRDLGELWHIEVLGTHRRRTGVPDRGRGVHRVGGGGERCGGGSAVGERAHRSGGDVRGRRTEVQWAARHDRRRGGYGAGPTDGAEVDRTAVPAGGLVRTRFMDEGLGGRRAHLVAPGALGTRHEEQVVVLGVVLGGVEEGVRVRGGGARLLHHACVLRQSLARDLAGVGHAYPSPIG